ncbi:MAG: gliding motility-associated C-terminal domain-containing protein [Bacteroidota bacterium]|jgi:gliding motility-associated-like protein
MRRYFFLLALTACTTLLSAQNPATTFEIPSRTINLPCGTNCTPITATVPHIKQTTDYVITNPAYSPFAWVTAAGVDVTNLISTTNKDDRWTSAINFFPFCYYGITHSSMVIGTNSAISFDLSLASTASGYSMGFSTPNLIPGTNYDANMIFGPYHDIDIEQPGANKRIEYRIEGTAPKRRLIASFNEVPYFGSSCGGFFATHQMVLYEGTGIVEVYIKDKPSCSGWNNGWSILGMQDGTRTKAIVAPGRNASVWGNNNMNECTRFVPSGGTPTFKSASLILNGSVVATADTSTTGVGKLGLSFPNICPPNPNTKYYLEVRYKDCNNPLNDIVFTDSVTVNKLPSSLLGTAAVLPASCGTNNGSITINNVAGGSTPYQFSIDGGVTWQTSNTFTGLAQGSYTINIKDASGVCTLTLNASVTLSGALPATTTNQATACTGVNNGSITVTSVGGAGPYTFSLNGGAPVAGTIPYTYSNLAAGGYTVLVRDQSNGCTTALLNVIVSIGSGVDASGTSSATSCPTVNNGSVTVTTTAGVAPFSFGIDGGALQAGTSPYTFSNLSPGNHVVSIRDALGCTRTLNVNVAPGPSLTAAVNSTATGCQGASNGTVTVTPSSGTGPYTYSIDNGAFVSGASPYTFNNLTSGNHTVVIRDAAGCASNIININVAAGPPLATTATKTDALCFGGSTGTITVSQPAAGSAPYQYSLDNATWQSSTLFSGLAAGTYTVYFREANGCFGSLNITVSQPTALSASATTVPVVCNGQSSGIIRVTGAGGITPYQFSLNGTTWQPVDSFLVSAGAYTIQIKDNNGCMTTVPISVTEPNTLSAVSSNTNASCNGGNDGQIVITATGGNSNYQYSIDGGLTWQSGNTFNVAPGNYVVQVKDGLGCSTSFNTTVGLTNDLTVTPQVDPTICESKSVQLDLQSNALQYSWAPVTALSNPNISNPVASPVVTTQYIVTAALGRCVAYDTVVVNVNPAPIPNAGPNGFICYGQTYQLQGSGGVQYRWTPSTYLSSTTVANPISTPSKDVTYTLSILADANGCASLVTDEMTIDVTPPLKLTTYPFDTIGYPGDQFQLLAVPNDPDATTFVWTPSVGLSNPSIANPVVTVGAIGQDIQYRVIASTQAGCRGEGYVKVRVYKGPDIYVPTGFTPNNDGKNDKFTPFPVGMKSYNYFRVFNRWGQVVFSTTRLNDGWDGRWGGVDQAGGTYVWMIEGLTKDNRVITKKGTVVMIR